MSSGSGPTQIDYGNASTARTWSGHPALANAIRVVLWVLPLAGSLLFGFWASQKFPPERLGINRWLWWLGLTALATALVRLLEQLTRRLTPLALLYRLSLIFPDEAPNRFSTALRSGTTTQTKKRIKAIQEQGGALSGDDSVAAQMLELIGLLSKHDKMTRGHAERVRGYTDMLAEQLELSAEDAGKLRWAALLHDMGKIDVPAEILNKPGKPTDEEWKILQGHPAAAEQHLAPIASWLGEWRHAADGHHERWDGGGYPRGLAGKDIPFSARIVAVADAYDVMTSSRSYKKPLPPEVARQEIANNAGSQFDPEVARAFLNIGLGDLRRATGPLAWVAGLPGLRNLPIGSTVTPVISNVVATAAAVVTAATGVVVASGGVAEEPPTAAPPIVSEELAFTDGEPEPTTTTTQAVVSTTTVAEPTPLLNQPPTAEAHTFDLDDGSTVVLRLPGSGSDSALVLDASDPDGDNLTVVVDDDATGGTVRVVGDEVIFTHQSGETSASFAYAVSDGEFFSAPQTVTFRVDPVFVPGATFVPATTSTTTTTLPAPTTTAAPTTTTTTTTTPPPVNQPPTTPNRLMMVHEDLPAGALVGQLVVSDPDVGDAHTFAITGGSTDHDGDGILPFVIDDDGLITVGDTDDDIDFGINGQTFTLLVTVADDGGLTDVATVKIDVDTRHRLSPSAHEVTINEVNPVTNEFVELINRTGNPVDISGWRLTDGDVVANDLDLQPQWRLDYTVPTGNVLPGSGRALIADQLPIGLGPTGADIHLAGGWNNRLFPGGDEVYLWDASGALVAFISWGDPTQSNNRNDLPPIQRWALWDTAYETTLSTSGSDRSISLAIDAGDPSDSACWEPTTSGDAAGRCAGALPTIRTILTSPNAHSAGMSNNVALGPAPADQNLSVHEDELVGVVAGTPDYNDPDSTAFTSTILSGNTDVDGDGNGPFSFDSTGALVVNDPDDIDFGVAGQSFDLGVEVVDHTSLIDDFMLTVDVESRHTKSPHAGSVLITEVNWQQQANINVNDEFVEIENVSSLPIDITGWRVADYDTVLGAPDVRPFVFDFPSRVLLPGRKAVVWVGPDTSLDATGAQLNHHAGIQTSLFHVAEDIWLHDSSGAIVAYVAWGGDTATPSSLDPRPPIVAFDLWDPAYELELANSQTGQLHSIALSVDGDPVAAADSACWEPSGSGEAGSRCTSGSTKTFDSDDDSSRRSSVGVDNNRQAYLNYLVFSELAINGSSPSTGDFIEIYNPTNHTINLAQYDLELALDGVPLPAVPLGAGLLDPGQFFLAVPAGSPLAATADLVVNVPSFSSTVGMRLYHRADPTIWYENWTGHVDRVGTAPIHDGDPVTPALVVGAPSGYVEASPILPLVATSDFELAMRRRQHGAGACVDSDDNLRDWELLFGVGIATPKSMASPKEFCTVLQPEPHTANSVVISEFWPAGRDRFSDEGLTLFNASDQPQSLLGYEVGFEKNGTETLVHTFSAADSISTLQPGQHLFLKRDIAVTGGPPDIVFTAILTDAGTGRVNVFLRDAGGATIDELVIGQSVSDAGVPPIFGWPERSWIRKGNGCVDTGVSTADFAFQNFVAARNSASPLQPCN